MLRIIICGSQSSQSSLAHMGICPCTYFFWPPHSSWQRQYLQNMLVYNVSPTSVHCSNRNYQYPMKTKRIQSNTGPWIIYFPHSKLFLKTSPPSALVNFLKSSNDSLQLMSRKTCVSTSDVVTEGIMNEDILVLYRKRKTLYYN